MSVALPVKQPTLRDFPPTLRKLVQYMIENHDYSSDLSSICEQIGVKRETVYNAIQRIQKRGLSFHDYLYSQREKRLQRVGIHVDNALVKGAINGKGKHIELYYRRLGELVDKQEIKHDIGLSFVFHSDSLPVDISPIKQGDHKVIDIEPTNKSNVR